MTIIYLDIIVCVLQIYLITSWKLQLADAMCLDTLNP